MVYDPDWESLAQSLTRIVSLGLDDQQAKIELCNAIADEKIKVRAFLRDDDEDFPGATFSGKEIEVPKRLKPDDFDWDQSLPKKDWYAGDPNNIRVGWELRKFVLVELCSAQVNAIFNVAGATPNIGPSANTPSASARRNSKLSKAAKTKKFKEWREARGDNVPTTKEDTAYMKKFGVGRDEVRLLRKDYPSLKRGKPKAN
jgi:hypothetical protein